MQNKIANWFFNSKKIKDFIFKQFSSYTWDVTVGKLNHSFKKAAPTNEKQKQNILNFKSCVQVIFYLILGKSVAWWAKT